jgi:hypothetical protein
VSLLIPARDEEVNLAANLPAAMASLYPDLEILVLDDGSTDGTAAVVEEKALAHPGVRLLRGTPPPEGWLGKNWACHQLADAAAGEVLIFCDADVWIGAEAIGRTVGTLQETGAGLLTALPRQVTRGTLAGAVVPLVAQLPVIALLPLRLAERCRSPALSMANGQWMAFVRDAYRSSGGHGAVRAEVLEDVALGRAVKRCGERLVIALAPDDLAVRMYPSACAVHLGFRKNLFALGGGRVDTFVLALGGFTLTMIYPLAAPLVTGGWGMATLGLLGAVRVLGVLATRHSALGIPLHPVGALATAALAVDSAIAARRGAAVWKGRPVAAAADSPKISMQTEDG